MAGQVISIPTSALQDAAVKYRKELLYMPIIGCNDTLQHMTPRPGIRYKENVGAVSGQLDVFYALQILMYTPVATAGCTGNTAEVTVNGEALEAVIGLVPELDGQPLGWINKGEYAIAEGYVVPSNIEAVAAVYGSYLPIEYLQDGIIWIQAE